MKIKTVAFSSIAVLSGASAFGQFLGPSPYLSAASSPIAGPGFSYFHLEDFEDAALAPGLVLFGGVRTLPSAFTDSVDGDDGLIDGSGIGGHSLITSGGSNSFVFAFDAGALGNFPTHAGVVWTDVGNVTSGTLGFGNVIFEAFDSAGASIGAFGPALLGDGSAAGGTAEDRFFGIIHNAGISRIVISMPASDDWEVDHVQYGYIPAPSAVVPLASSLLWWSRRRRPACKP